MIFHNARKSYSWMAGHYFFFAYTYIVCFLYNNLIKLKGDFMFI